jgi:hypothetical protein
MWILFSAVLELWVFEMYKGCSESFAPHYFSQPLTKIEQYSFEGLKSDVSPAHNEF